MSPVTSARIQTELTSWDHVGYGIDYAPAKAMGLNNIYVRMLTPSELLAGGKAIAQWDAFDLTEAPSSSRKGEASFKIREKATIHGFAIWWTAELAPGVILSTGPDAPRTHWEQLYLPLLTPLECSPGETVGIALRSRTSHDYGTTLAWTVTHTDAKSRQLSRQTLDLEKGYLP